MIREQNVQNVHDRKCDNQGKHETFKREEREKGKRNQQKQRKKAVPSAPLRETSRFGFSVFRA